MISSFSKETCEQLEYYVYRLIDPRNGLTFYVGKGKNDRVFAHVKCALKDYNGGNYETDEDDEDDLKLQTIIDVNDSGLEVIHLIHRFGMDEKTALEVEGALIDAYYSLTNKASGYHNSDYGISNAEEIERRFCKTEYQDKLENPKYIIIKTNKWRIDEVEGKTYAERLYSATKWCKKINPKNAKLQDKEKMISSRTKWSHPLKWG